MDALKTGLDFLLAPVGTEEFFSRYWETAPLVVSRKEPERYLSLLGAADLDHVISTAFLLQKSSVETLAGSENAKHPGGGEPQHVADIYNAYRQQGATVRVNRVQRHWKPLREMCRELERFFGFPVRANLYCSPASGKPSTRHYDNHDVLVLQLAGRKQWRVYNPVVSLPLATVPPLPFEERTEMLKYARGGPKKGRADIDDAEAGAPTHEFTLEAGDLLYLPRGFVHEARTSADSSAHVTIGLHVLRWMDLLSVALARLSNRDERFRKALPHGAFSCDATQDGRVKEEFDALLQAFAAEADLKSAVEEMAGSFIHSRQAVGDGTLADAAASPVVDADTLLERRPGLLCRFVDEGEMVSLVSTHSTLRMPKSFASALRFVAGRDEFRVGELPAQLSENSKLVLARRLVQDGFLRKAL